MAKASRSAQRTRLQHRIEVILLTSVIVLVRLIPVDAASAAMGFAWQKIAPLTARHKRALEHLARALPEASKAEREKIARGMWNNLGRVAAETFFIDRLISDDARFVLDADGLTNEVLKTGKACIVVSLHTGNWEMCVRPITRQGHEVTGVYQALKNPNADKIVRDLRKDLYKGGLYSKSHETARKLISTLKKGGIVGFMADLRERRGIKVPFFGRPAYANPVPASLARSAGVPIIVGRVIRKRGARFLVEGRGLKVPVTDDRKADIAQATAEMHRIFEAWIRERPEQWMWIHRKWADA